MELKKPFQINRAASLHPKNRLLLSHNFTRVYVWVWRTVAISKPSVLWTTKLRIFLCFCNFWRFHTCDFQFLMVSDMCRRLLATHPSNALSHLPPSPVKHTLSRHLSSCIFFPCAAHLVRVVHVNRGGRVFTTGECSWMEECLPSMYKALGSILSAVKQTHR